MTTMTYSKKTRKLTTWKNITPAKARKMMKLLKKAEDNHAKAGKNISLMRRALKARMKGKMRG